MNNNKDAWFPSERIPEAVTSLVYASAVNVILGRSVGIADSYHYFGIGIIIFLFVDWISRIWIPFGFKPTEDQHRRRLPWVIVTKAFFEIVIIYFLVAATIKLFIGSESVGAQLNSMHAFAIFFGLSFCWNLLMLYVMTELKFSKLFISAMVGCVYELKAVEIYTAGFKNRTESVKREGKFNLFHWKRFLEGIGRTSAQLAGHHITWVNPLASITLLLGIDSFYLSQYSGGWLGNLWMFRIFILFLLMLLPSLFYFVGTLIADGTSKDTIVVHLIKVTSAVFVFALTLTFYMTFDAASFIYVMIVQHTVFGIFLLYATHAKSSNDDQKTDKPKEEKKQ